MFLALWNYICGYVIIYVTGFSVERMLNMAINKGVFIWDIQYDKNRVRIKTAIGNIGTIKDCCIKTGCIMSAEGSFGLPTVLNKCRRQKVFVGGIALFAVVMYIMSMFIWTVNIEGNERISSEDILSACEKNGVAPGRLKDGIDFYKVGESLMIEFKDISWIAVHLDGTAVTVRLVETIPKKDYVEKEEYKDYVADRSGTIVSIAASSGIPVVEPGDEVSDGDILISSTVPLKDGETQIGEKKVCADGEVYAERKYELEGISDINYKKRVFTGNTKTDYSVIINENEINIITPSDIDGYALKTDDRIQFRIGDYVIPFSINKKVYEKYNIEKCVRTEEEAQSLADRQLDEELARLLADTGGELSEMHRDILINENNVTIKGYVYIIEKIGIQRAVTGGNEEVTE